MHPGPLHAMSTKIPATELKRTLNDGGEIALLDLREEVDYMPRHLLFASCAPLGRLEIIVDDLVPRRSTRMVLMDAGEGYADEAWRKLGALGYTDVRVLAGGIDAWREAGYELFEGMHVPSKAFGELVEEQCGTPRLAAEEIHRLHKAGEDMVILDSRPFTEYVRQSIPGAIDCPGAELVYRFQDLAPSSRTLVVVNCAGRTRSIIGAQSLLNAGVPNRVVALKNGTMGWHLAGLGLEKGARRTAPAPSAHAIGVARERAERIAQAAGVRTIDRETYLQWQAERDERTVYVFDVRSPEEYEEGHLAEAVSAPGGQLVQDTDSYAAALYSRIVLVDGDGVRAKVTAAWLRQMGWRDVVVLAGAMAPGTSLLPGKRRSRVLGLGQSGCERLQPEELRRRLGEGGMTLVDVASLTSHRRGHVAGARYALRANLRRTLPALPSGASLCFTSSDGVTAQLAAEDVTVWRDGKVFALAGGTAAWRGAGLPLETGCTAWLDEPREVWTPYQRVKGEEARMSAYLKWETGLVRQIERDGDARFRLMRPGFVPADAMSDTENGGSAGQNVF
jgi:rhodanese-related sulfurtransferase